VLLAGRDDDQVALGHVLLLPADLRLPGAADEGQDLIGVLVHLLADLATRRDGHDHQLAVLAGPEHTTEVGALLGDGRDGEVLHAARPLSSGGAVPARGSPAGSPAVVRPSQEHRARARDPR
jgi:hypothetical protein